MKSELHLSRTGFLTCEVKKENTQQEKLLLGGGDESHKKKNGCSASNFFPGGLGETEGTETCQSKSSSDNRGEKTRSPLTGGHNKKS